MTRLHILFLAMTALALLGPRWGAEQEEARAKGIDLLIALDVSRSMLARDVSPDRLERAKEELRKLVAHLGQDRLALLVFAGEAKRSAPLTADHESFLSFLEETGVDSVRQGGTNFAAALEQARALLAHAETEAKTVLLISDGEDRGSQAQEQVALCAAEGIVLHSLAIGTEAGGKITLQDEQGQEYFLRDGGGEEVVSRLQPDSLQAMAVTTGGSALRVGEDNLLIDWYERSLLPMAQERSANKESTQAANQFQIPLAIAIFIASLVFAGFGRRRGT